MTGRWATAACLLLVAVLSFFVFPGHTILQSDTQIYIPILEHIADPTVFTRDIMAVRPHVAFTLYDDLALFLRRATGLSFEQVLLSQQFVYRAFGILGLYWIATSTGLTASLALVVTALVSLGAAVIGPAVLVIEYEPVPRGFSLPLILFSLGALAHKHSGFAAAAAGVAFAFHPPTALAYVCLVALVLVRGRQWKALAILAVGPLALAASAAGAESPPVITRITPDIEAVQRIRASYNWVGIWAANWMGLYALLWLVGFLAWWRVRKMLPRQINVFPVALPAIGMASVLASYFLLERMKLGMAAQFQPGRYLLFVTLFAMLLSAITAAHAAWGKRPFEALAFCVVPLSLAAMEWDTANLTAYRMAFVCTLAIALTIAMTAAPRYAALAVGLPFLVLPYGAGVQTYPPLHTAELNALSDWARAATPKDAVFQFADTGRKLEPGVFRARAFRAIFVDWKSGGQVNFLNDFASIWNDRWNRTRKPLTLEEYSELGIDYVVFPRIKAPRDQSPIYENPAWAVYASSGRKRLNGSLPPH